MQLIIFMFSNAGNIGAEMTPVGRGGKGGRKSSAPTLGPE
jgi:hypothetical protein